MITDDMQLQILNHLKVHGESTTKQIVDFFPQFENRVEVSKFMGNLRRRGLTAKNNPNLWALTSSGRAAVDGCNHPGVALAEPKGDISEKVTAVADWEKSIRDTSPKPIDESANPVPVSSWDMARQLQHEIPNGSSLVIEADEIFLAWRGARFAIEQRKDLDAFKAIQEAYIGEVA